MIHGGGDGTEVVGELGDPCEVNRREDMAGSRIHEVGESELGRGSTHLKGRGSMIRASTLHSCDFAPLVSYLSAMINHSTRVSRCSSKDRGMKG